MTTKYCPSCKLELPLDAFGFNKKLKDGRMFYCKNCKKGFDIKWRSKNKEYYTRKNVEWVKANKEKVQAIKHKYYEANKEKLKERANLWIIENPEKRRLIVNAGMSKRRKTLRGNLNHRMSVRINELLRKNKNRRCWKSVVDYTLEDLKRHLEKQFLPGMTWENRNLWHIDHKIPISAFTFEKPEDDGFKRCWDLSNLQPLWAPDNIRKSNHFDIRNTDSNELLTFTP